MIAYQFTPQATDDLLDIWSYVAQDNPEAADRIEAAVFESCDLLAVSPLAGRKRRDLTEFPLRFLVVRPYSNYLIVYDPETRPLQIIRILHGARNLPGILK